MRIVNLEDDNVKLNNGLSSIALPIVEQALAYARRGFYVLPLVDKKPLIDGGYKAATNDELIIGRWWGEWPKANIGIATGVTSGVLVVDVDPRNGGVESFKKLRSLLVAQSSDNLGTPVVRTGGGGFHVYYECRVPMRSREFKEDYPGIDILADKKYVVAPPSIHPDTGTPYEWYENRSLEDMALIPIPDGLVSLIKGKDIRSSSSNPNNPKSNPLDGFPNSQRHVRLRDYAWSLCHDKNLSQPEVLELVLRAASNCSPPCDHEEATNLVTSAFEKLKVEKPELEIVSATDLLEKELPPPRCTIDGLLPEGVVLLAAGPKEGKSTLARNMAVSVAEGTLLAGRFDCEQGQVLYLCLEEGERALQSYLKKMGRCPPQLEFGFRSSRGTDAVQAIESWLESKDDPRLVVIDLLEHVRRERKRSESLYAYDTDSLFAFRKKTDDYPGLTILILHHNRKAPGSNHQEKISGSTGLAGSTDCNMTMTRNRSDNYAVLEGTSRMIGDFEHVFLFDPDSQILSWRDPECFLMSEKRRQVIELLRSVYPDSIALRDIEKDLGAKGVRVLLSRMSKEGIIARSSRGMYCFIDRFGTRTGTNEV